MNINIAFEHLKDDGSKEIMYQQFIILPDNKLQAFKKLSRMLTKQLIGDLHDSPKTQRLSHD